MALHNENPDEVRDITFQLIKTITLADGKKIIYNEKVKNCNVAVYEDKFDFKTGKRTKNIKLEFQWDIRKKPSLFKRIMSWFGC